MSELEAIPAQPAPGVDPHAITAGISLQEMRLRVLKHDDAFAVLDPNGDALPVPGSPEGLYHQDTRHLSRLELCFAGARPLLLSSGLSDDGEVLTCDLTNPDLPAQGPRPALERDRVHLRRSKFIRGDICFERIAVRSFADQTLALPIELRFAADFADLFEVRGTRRRRRGTQHPPEPGPDGVVLAYTGLDQRRRTTRLRFDPMPDRITGDHAVFTLVLAPGERRTILLEVQCGAEAAPPRPPRTAFLRAFRDSCLDRRAARARGAAVLTSDAVFDETISRSVNDLGMLITETPDGPYPYAGVPWFSTVFGRDGLITAWLTLWLDPAIALGVLRHLAALQATTTDPAADAEPGKILHELRSGEMAELGEVPFRRYYGSVDATPLFVALAGAWLDRTGEAEALRPLWPNIEAALQWIERYGDRDGDGFVEYGRRTATGLANQGWKDSWDSVFHEDGTLAEGPIALCEVQAYVYAAFLAGARIARALGLAPEQAVGLEVRAAALSARFEAAFWSADLGTYVLALDGAKRPCRVRASNAGHALLGGIAAPERAAAVAHQLLTGIFYSGWGVRTVATTEARYNPMSYHNGSVWPHDGALIGLGLARYGHRAAAARLLEGLAAAAARLELRRLPELFCGFPRR
ncbi:MAG TPA: glycogen debranching N-terminal domain-containing protein, partial [Crenalkalicoccus sp.]|nr:glycogen debranching N-terminal domain-containing protein [Crenalkalicoccus sp.]